MVINITGCEYTEDPELFARQLPEIAIGGGNVLVKNIFVTDQIVVNSTIKEWYGYRFNEPTGDTCGDRLRAISLPLPSSFAQIMNEPQGLKLREGTAMMFPGNNIEFVKCGFAMSVTDDDCSYSFAEKLSNT